jgi:alpha-L-fucosidase
MKQNKGFDWWREAKFGMFIHWGLYAIPGGIWDGKEIPGIGEWIMGKARIPVSEYSRLAGQFNPTGLEAREWIRLAKRAGMKYVVITAKHHDGFAMYDSACSGYDIVDATPYGKDPMPEIAEECRKQGIKLCFYYSQVLDWHHPDALGNDWDYPDEGKKNFKKYLEEKVKPQLRELLTNYGPVGIMWFDMPLTMAEEDSRALADYVHQLQPDCLISGRIGNGIGNYKSTCDNMIPYDSYPCDWEMPATLNDTWGYKKNDHNWKSAKKLIRLMVDVNRKGGNYLLNVGPTPEGRIPGPSAEILETVGKWLEVNGEAIYGTVPCRSFPYELAWGDVTARPGKLFFHIFDWPQGDLTIHGLRNPVKKIYLLADPRKKEIGFEQMSPSKTQNMHKIRISLPGVAADPIAAVVAVEIDGLPDIDILTTDMNIG